MPSATCADVLLDGANEAFTNPFCFHIGYHRTGTTYLQKFILPQLRRSGDVLPPNEVARPLKRFLLHDIGLDAEELKTVGSYLRDERRSVFLSNEALSGDLYRDYLGMARRMRALFPNCRVLLTLRSQYTVIASMYQQLYIKNGGTGSYSTYLDEVIRNDKWNYHAIVSSYAETCGDGAIRVLLFEDLQRDPRAFVRDFLQFAGLPPVSGTEHSVAHRNERPNILEAHVGRWTNRFLADDSLLARVLPSGGRSRLRGARGTALRALRGLGTVSKSFGMLDERAFEHDAVCRARIESHYAASNRQLAESLGIELVGYPGDRP